MLTVGTITPVCDNTVAAGNVTGQSPTAGSSISLGSSVNIEVSTGPCCVLFDMNYDGFVSIVGDVEPFVKVVYFNDLNWYEQNFPGKDPICPGDGNGDGFISIVGDVQPFVNCVYFGNCPE